MKTMSLRLPSVVLAAAVALVATGVNAASTIWTLHNVNMSGGTALDGTFTTNSATGLITAWDVNMVGGPYGTGTGYHFSNLIANYASLTGPQSFEVNNFGGGDAAWTFISSLAGAPRGGSVDISTASFFCQACGNYSVAGEGGFATANVPEPATWAIMLAGFAGAGAALRRSRKQRSGRQIA
jgi:hypothetical protein